MSADLVLIETNLLFFHRIYLCIHKIDLSYIPITCLIYIFYIYYIYLYIEYVDINLFFHMSNERFLE